MSKRDFGKLASLGSAAAANGAGLASMQKDRVIYLDPAKDILYEPEENVRDNGVLEADLESLVSLRLTLDGEGQLQPIRVYPLPADKLDPAKKDMKYGVAYGHRRLLACRLTSADSPLVGDQPKKIMALVDSEWLTKGRAYRLRCQIQENKNRVDLNFVEEGEALKRYREELSREEGRSVPQRELIEIFGIPEKTLGYLMQAAEFERLAKDACNKKILTDLDSLVTFDAICKANADFAAAMYASLEDREAPRTRTMIRAAKTFLEANKDYVVDGSTWVWPDLVMTAVKPKSAEVAAPAATPVQATQTAPAPDAAIERAGIPDSNDHARVSQASDVNPGAAEVPTEESTQDGGGRPVVDLEFKQPGQPEQPVVTGAHGDEAAAEKAGALATKAAPEATKADTAKAEVAQAGPETKASPVVVVSFKMGDAAPREFNGELLLSRPAKAPNLASVAYLNEGREEVVEVPLRLISLVSINH